MSNRLIRVLAHWKPETPSDQEDMKDHQLIFDLIVDENDRVVNPSSLMFGSYGAYKSIEFYPFEMLGKKIKFSKNEEAEESCDITEKFIRNGEYFNYERSNGSSIYQISRIERLL